MFLQGKFTGDIITLQGSLLIYPPVLNVYKQKTLPPIKF